MRLLALALLLAPVCAQAETLVAARTIRSQTILAPEDLSMLADTTPGALTDPIEAIGLEARVVLYAGRPIRPDDIGPAATVERNQIVALIFQTGPLTISVEGRALERGGSGDAIRVMNLTSRNTVTGVVGNDGAIHVLGSARNQP